MGVGLVVMAVRGNLLDDTETVGEPDGCDRCAKQGDSRGPSEKACKRAGWGRGKGPIERQSVVKKKSRGGDRSLMEKT